MTKPTTALACAAIFSLGGCAIAYVTDSVDYEARTVTVNATAGFGDVPGHVPDPKTIEKARAACSLITDVTGEVYEPRLVSADRSRVTEYKFVRVRYVFGCDPK